MKKTAALFLLGLMAFSSACSNTSTSISQNIDTVSSDTGVNSFAKNKITTNDDEISGSSGKNSAIKQNKLVGESIVKNSTELSFKTVQTKKGKTTASREANTFILKGSVSYFDDKGNTKPGANLTVNLTSDNAKVGSVVTDESGAWTLAVDKSKYQGKTISTNFQFSNKYWMIGGKGQTYKWDGPQSANLNSDVDFGTISPVKDSENAKAAFINDIYNRYQLMFKKEGVDVTKWWTQQLRTVWPGSGDFYSGGTVNLTEASHWDVNGHEIGHAMTDIGTNSDMGGGQHKIDECYSKSLAWSEGFATFLSAVISIDKADADAKFEFLVPRRAPIREENVPQDVCNGQNNEWRVSAAMWDLYDTHTDGDDNMSVPFKTIWESVSRNNKRITGIKDAVDSLKEIAPQYSDAIDKSVKFNTMF